MNSPGAHDSPPEWLNLVRQQVGSMRFGVVQIVVHEGHVVQIERTEKVRLPTKPGKATDVQGSAPAEG
jgi:hypothetical protein